MPVFQARLHHAVLLLLLPLRSLQLFWQHPNTSAAFVVAGIGANHLRRPGFPECGSQYARELRQYLPMRQAKTTFKGRVCSVCESVGAWAVCALVAHVCWLFSWLITDGPVTKPGPPALSVELFER